MAEGLTWLPAWQIRELIVKREVSPVEVTEHFLGRIQEHDGTLHALLFVDSEGARRQATAAEAAVLAGEELGPLHGIPVSVKSHIDVTGFPKVTPGGETTATHDHLAVERLRAAGAVIVGHNTMMGSGADLTQSSAPGVYAGFNWNVEARNPWDPTRVPGWSSSGGAASAVARLLPITLGSDGGGSTRLPAAYSGVVGVHPTGGLIPWVDYGHYATRPGSTVGPLARDALDAAIALAAMQGPDGRDFVGLPIDLPSALSEIDSGADGLRLAWTDDYGFTDIYGVQESPSVIAAARDAAFGLRTVGATVDTTTEEWEDFWPGISVHHAVYSPMAILGPESGAQVPADQWDAAHDRRRRNWERFRRLFHDYDLLLSATSQILAPKVETWNGWWTTDGPSFYHGTFAPVYCSHTWMFNWLAFPAVSVPCGFVDGLPVGLQIVGPPGSDAKVMRTAVAFQKAFPRHERPSVS
jgi:Asp-tRNA(Asn)/Glu-tRNA(Gln) amidotransferase A subunit family amidase